MRMVRYHIVHLGIFITISVPMMSGIQLDIALAAELNGGPATLRTVPAGTVTDRPARNSIFLCGSTQLGPDFTASGTPWVHGTTIVNSQIPFVEGQVKWHSTFETILTPSTRRFKGNGVPTHPTGIYPVQEGTEAYKYYSQAPAAGYSSAAAIPIAPYDLDITVPRHPVAALPNCIPFLNTLVIGIAIQTHVPWHVNLAYGSGWVDPVAALPPDQCWGHPYAEQYHYHGYSWKCFPDQGKEGEHSPLFGYAIDGFGIYGPRGENGKYLTNQDLDECHGIVDRIFWDGEWRLMYHYVLNDEFPYGPGCFLGTPATLPPQFQHDLSAHGAPTGTGHVMPPP
jgi:hypothetical protein